MDQHDCASVLHVTNLRPSRRDRRQVGAFTLQLVITALFPCQHRMTKATSLVGHDRIRMAATNMCNDHTSTAKNGWPSNSTAARGTTVKNSVLRNADRIRRSSYEPLRSYEGRSADISLVTKGCVRCRVLFPKHYVYKRNSHIRRAKVPQH